MRNLVLEGDKAFIIPLEADEYVVKSFCNTSESCAYLATSFLDVLSVSLQDGKVLWRQPLGTVTGGPDSQITALAHSLELDSLVVGISTGELLVLQCETQQVEELGGLEGGVSDMAWSPDGEVLVIATGAGRLLMMNQEWQLQAEVLLAGASADTVEPDARTWSDVVLTWRADGRYLATSSRTHHTSGERCVQIYDRDQLQLHATAESAPGWFPLLAWQPNGRHLYTVHTPVPATAAPTTLTGTPNNPKGVRASARAAAAAAAIPIKSSKQAVGLLAGEAQGAVTPKVLLLERNGLQHGGFELRQPGPVTCIAWSRDSELLAVVQEAEGDAAGHILQVWHRSNWHWYLKFERRLPASGQPDAPGPAVSWDEQVTGRLHVLAAAGPGAAPGAGAVVYQQLHLVWDTLVSELGTAVVVDGEQLALTTLRHAVVPPPMSSVRATLPAPAVCVAISSHQQQDERLVAVLSSGGLALMRSVEEDLWEETLEEQQDVCRAGGVSPSSTLQPLLAPLPPTPLMTGRHIRSVAWLDACRLLALATSPTAEAAGGAEGGEVLLELQVAWPQAEPDQDALLAAQGPLQPPAGLTLVNTVQLGSSRVSNLVQHASGVLVQLSTGEVRLFRPGAAALAALPAEASFKEPCVRLLPVPPLPQSVLAARPAFGLTLGGSLFWGADLIAADVTSATLRTGGPGGPALLYCTRRNLLYTVFLSQLMAGGYIHKELTEEAAGGMRQQRIESDFMRAAMHQAMRPQANQAAARDVVVRAVEQGAALLSAPRDGVLTVLQMPRGNLEGIQPRALVLAAIAAALTNKQYAHAWKLASINRVDLNLIVDWGYPYFLHHTTSFVESIPSASDLCDLLFALRPENMCDEGGLYAGIPVTPPSLRPAAQAGGKDGMRPHWEEEEEEEEDEEEVAPAPALQASTAPGALPAEQITQLVEQGSKINAVCTALRAAVLARMEGQAQGLQGPGLDARQVVGMDGVARALPSSAAAAAASELLSVVVTSYVRCDPPELGKALLAVKQAKEAELAGPSGAAGSPEGAAERALRAMLLNVDVDTAYKAALGLYELPLAFMVINHAQKDPGEYLLELQRFAAIKDAQLRGHAIDLHLERWESALQHLVAAGPDNFDKALALAKDKSLLRHLLKLLDTQAPEAAAATAPGSSSSTGQLSQRQVVLCALAESQSAAHKHEDAGLTYLAAGDLKQALAAYRAGGQWRQVMLLAGKLQYDPQQTARLAGDMADELAASAQHAPAAALLIHYLQDVDNGVAQLALARDWREAMRVAYQHSRQDLVTTVIAPSAAESAKTLLSDARESRERMAKYLTRLREVRNKREALAAAVQAAAEAHGGVGPTAEEMQDAASDTAVSALTGLSIYTENTHAGTGTVTGSTRAPSTMGGRRAHKADKRRQNKAKKGRVRQGSPEEEASLVSHLLGLGPPDSVLEEAGTLAELLVLLGHEPDARTLQAGLTAWQAEHQAVQEELAVHPVPADNVPKVFHHILTFYQQRQQPAGVVIDTKAAGPAWKWDLLRAVA